MHYLFPVEMEMIISRFGNRRSATHFEDEADKLKNKVQVLPSKAEDEGMLWLFFSVVSTAAIPISEDGRLPTLNPSRIMFYPRGKYSIVVIQHKAERNLSLCARRGSASSKNNYNAHAQLSGPHSTCYQKGMVRAVSCSAMG